MHAHPTDRSSCAQSLMRSRANGTRKDAQRAEAVERERKPGSARAFGLDPGPLREALLSGFIRSRRRSSASWVAIDVRRGKGCGVAVALRNGVRWAEVIVRDDAVQERRRGRWPNERWIALHPMCSTDRRVRPPDVVRIIDITR